MKHGLLLASAHTRRWKSNLLLTWILKTGPADSWAMGNQHERNQDCFDGETGEKLTRQSPHFDSKNEYTSEHFGSVEEEARQL